MTDIDPHHITTVVFQDVLEIIVGRVKAIFTSSHHQQLSPIIDHAKKLTNWPKSPMVNPLRSIFDDVGNKENSGEHYWPLKSIENNASENSSAYPSIPYPIALEQAQSDIAPYREMLIEKIRELVNDTSWSQSTVLGLFLEKYGSCISFGLPDISLNDLTRTTAAVAAALAQAHNAGKSIEDTNFRLIAGDISGIQSFIYNISSDGALKSLRARSFFLELVTIEIVQQLLEKLGLSQSNVIYSGGGNVYILAADIPEVEQAMQGVGEIFNHWFIKSYQGKLFLALDSIDFPQIDIGNSNFANHWTRVTQELQKHKNRKFSAPIQLQQRLNPSDSHEPCKVCHRDDTEDLHPLNPDNPTDSVAACVTCRSMFQLGTQLFKAKLIVRSTTRPQSGEEYAYYKSNADHPQFIAFDFSENPVYYRVFGRNEDEIPTAIAKAKKEKNTAKILLIDNWELKYYQQTPLHSILLGNYYQVDSISDDVREDAFITAEELATIAQGIDRVGYLRMDVDNLGQIFARELQERSLPKLAALSRQMNYFFKVYLNSLAARRAENSLEFSKLNPDSPRSELLFIYTGGDDLFVSGAWNQIAEFACDIYQSFRRYTGENPAITISGGISINTIKYPLYRAADEAGAAEKRAKKNQRDSLDLFGETFKWSHWLGTIDALNEPKCLADEPALETNILQLVQALSDPDKIGYSRAFLRNLLILADIRRQKIIDLKKSDPTRDELIYYLHLPKLEYAISRLPQKVRDRPEFRPVHQALRNPRSSPYFQAIATWVELLNRKPGANNHDRD
jgi:CRISPR-associated protein Csm1